MDMIKRLDRPHGKVRLVLDTDTYNEIDDQFAVSYALASPDEIELLSINAAPFFNQNSTSPEDGMNRSYDEIMNLLTLAGRQDMKKNVHRGSKNYLPDEKTPVESEACDDLIKKARETPDGEQLYVAAIGAITNVASALIKAPDIAGKLVIVWLGGHALEWPDTREFNMYQDIAAARVVFDSNAALVQLPCMGVVDHVSTTRPELEYWLKGKNPLADYLAQHTIEEAESYAAGTAWSRVIWDITTIGWLLDRDGKMMSDTLEHRPIPEYDGHYAFDPRREFYRYVRSVNRDALFTDMFRRLTR